MSDLTEKYEIGADLVERSGLLDDLDRALKSARRGAGRLVLLAGEAGVGKTVLLRTFCTDLDGDSTYWGQCERLFSPRALGPFVDIAEQVGGDVERLVAEGGHPHEYVRALIRSLPADRATIVVIEDLNWADETTLDVLKLLSRRVETLPVLMIASYRNDQFDLSAAHQLVVNELAAGQQVECWSVPPLSLDAVRALADVQGVSGDLLFRRTGGNPFFVTELLAAPSTEFPDTVRDAVLARTAQLKPATRRLLEAVSVVPSRVETRLLEAVVGQDLHHLTECLECGMLRADGPFVAFRHDIARMAIESTIAPHRRLELHRRILGSLSDSASGPVDPARLSHHASEAGDVAGVLAHAPAAGARASALGAHLLAAEQYERALQHADALPLDRRGDLFEALARERHLGEYDPELALTAARSALALRRRTGQILEQGRTLQLLARLLWYCGHPDEAEASARGAVDLIRTVDSGGHLAMAYADLERITMHVHKLDESLVWAERAISLATSSGAVDALASGLASLGVTQLRAGDPDGWGNLERSVSLAEATGNDEELGRALVSLAVAAVDDRAYEKADRLLLRAFAYAEERETSPCERFLISLQARLAFERSQWSDALGYANRVLRPGRPAVNSSRTACTVIVGRARVRTGDMAARAALDDAAAIAAVGDVVQMASVAIALAEYFWLVGEPERVGDATDAAFELACTRQSARYASELAYWRWKSGVVDRLPPLVSGPYRWQIDGDWSRAADHWRELGCAYDEAMALAESGLEPDLRRALSEFRSLGAAPAAQAVAKRLRSIGVRAVGRGASRSTLAGPANLTTRQVEIATLLQQRLTNAEIASRLHLSPKTVDHHVSAVLHKLGVSSRRQVAERASELGIGA